MPILDDDPSSAASGPTVVARPSIPVEADWALSAAHRPTPTLHPALAALYADQEVADAVRGLWGPGEQLSYPGYLELSAVAQPAGLLFTTDSDAFVGRLEAMCAAAPVEHQFLAETAADRAVLLHRLDVLRSDPDRRRHYAGVVGRVWSALAGVWQREGLPAVEAEVARRRVQIEREPDWRRLVARQLSLHEPSAELLDAVGAGGEVVVVPAWFTRKRLWIDLPGVLLIGVGTADTEARNRERAESLGKRLKALSDPTRLTILYSLTMRPMTVGELADHLNLAQPTVSNHVKLLREAGLVSSRPDGRGQPLTGERSELAGLLADVADLVGCPVQPGPPSAC